VRAAMTNIDTPTVAGFGDEWQRFNFLGTPDEALRPVFDEYFAVFPWDELPPNAVGFDAGVGSGRWARLAAPRVGKLHCVDASEEALGIARQALANTPNVELHHASIDAMPFPDESMDFGYSLGVLHHMPDTKAAIASCVRKLKKGAPLLIYLYYAFDNRPFWFPMVWKATDMVRHVVSRTPHPVRYAVSQALAASVYWPLARTARVLERAGMNVENIPLSAYRDRTFYMMRNDALDRFGTRLDQRFTQAEMTEMMRSAGLERIRFHDKSSFWTAVGYRA
jgi:ubiquinone/menaquinone biosynthesis C-methylase UbiE